MTARTRYCPACLAAAAAAILLSVQTAAAEPAAADPASADPDTAIPPIAIGPPDADQGLPDYRVDFAQGVRMRPDVIYWSPRGYRPLRMDIYQPPPTARNQPLPVILFIHGGGWIAGDSRSFSPIGNFPSILAGIAARGYVVASLDYRFSREARWPAQGQDVKAAIRWLRANAADLDVDPQRVGVWGISAGGQLSAVAATTCGLPALQPDGQVLPGLKGAAPGNGDCVQAAAAWFGVYDMTTLTHQAEQAGAMSRKVDGAPEWRLLGCRPDDCTTEKLTSASAVLTLDDDTPPVLLVTGDRDKVVPPAQSMQFAEALAAQKIPHELLVMAGTGHNLSAPDRRGTRRALQQALDRTLAFFDRELGRSSAPPLPPPLLESRNLARD